MRVTAPKSIDDKIRALEEKIKSLEEEQEMYASMASEDPSIYERHNSWNQIYYHPSMLKGMETINEPQIREYKKEINQILEQAGKPPKYII